MIPLDHPEAVRSPMRRQLYQQVLARSLRRAARIIVPSTLTRDRLAEHGVAPERLTVVPLAVGPRFRPRDEAERDRARREFAEGRPYVAGSSGARAHKNLSGLNAAAALLAPRVPVVLTGVRPEQARADHLRFLGRLDDDALARFYGGAEVMVLPALVEGFGLPALEALASGVPVVCGSGTGALDVVAAGALVVDVTQPLELAGGVAALLDDGEHRKLLAAAGREAAEGFTAERMATATLAIYLDVLAQRSVTTSR